MQTPVQVDSLAADSLTADTLALDSAAADTLVVLDSTGIGALNESVGQAVEELSRGEVHDALTLLGAAVWSFALENLLPALVVALAFWVAYRLLHGLIHRTLRQTKHIGVGVQQLVLKTLRTAVIAFGAITVLGQLGINVAALVAGLGIAGLALGFAAQDTLQNFIAGVTILVDRPFRVGDNIVVQDTFGTVDEITLRSTRVRTLDHQVVILPNAKVITEKITNHTMLSTLRLVIPFGIAYDESPQAAREVLLKLAEGDARLHPDYPPSVIVTHLGESSVDMAFRVYLKDPSLEVPVRDEYYESVVTALTEAGIEIPFPHVQLRIDEAKAFEDAPFMQPRPPLGGEEARA